MKRSEIKNTWFFKSNLWNFFKLLKLYYMWQEKNNKLYRKFQFKDFSEAFAFMTRVALAGGKNGPPSPVDQRV